MRPVSIIKIARSGFMMVFAKAFGDVPSLAKLSQRQLAALTLSLVERPRRDQKRACATQFPCPLCP
jgi:hypothetical protein